jgi:hypothetical protein
MTSRKVWQMNLKSGSNSNVCNNVVNQMVFNNSTTLVLSRVICYYLVVLLKFKIPSLGLVDEQHVVLLYPLQVGMPQLPDL